MSDTAAAAHPKRHPSQPEDAGILSSGVAFPTAIYDVLLQCLMVKALNLKGLLHRLHQLLQGYLSGSKRGSRACFSVSSKALRTPSFCAQQTLIEPS